MRNLAIRLAGAFSILLGFGNLGLTQIETRTFTLHSEKVALPQVLRELQRQTGVSVIDERNEREVEIRVDLEKVGFWKALDTIAREVGARAVLNRVGQVALVRKPQKESSPPPTSYDGDFRLRIVRTQSSKDLERNAGSTAFTIEVAWTPTLRPLFLDTQPRNLRILEARNKPLAISEEGSSLVPVDGRTSSTLELTLPAFPRSRESIDQMEGQFLIVAPSKFLTFGFDTDLPTLQKARADGAVRRLVEEGVGCRIDRVVLSPERWSVQVGLDYPAGGRELESYQAGSLVVNNELVLTSLDGKRILVPTSQVIDLVSSRRAQVTYHFTDRPGARRGPASGWKVSYRAPARIVEAPIRFRFDRVPLP